MLSPTAESMTKQTINPSPQLPQITIIKMAYFEIQIATSGNHAHIKKKNNPTTKLSIATPLPHSYARRGGKVFL